MRHHRSIAVCTVAVVALWACGLALDASGRAAFAAPTAGAILTVNTSTDSYVAGDGVLSLRKAVSITNGTLTGPFSLSERLQMQGCVFDSSGFITNACGGSYINIRFTPTLTRVVLVNRLPNIAGTGTSISGSVASGVLIVDGSGGADNGFIAEADDVTLANLAIINIGGASSSVQTYIFNAHKGLRVFNNYLNVLPDTTTCSDPRLTAKAAFGLFVWVGNGTVGPGAGTAYFYDNVIGCAFYDGIEVSQTPFVYIGQDELGNPRPNYIGISRTGNALPNGGSGINYFYNTAQHGVIANNIIAYNTGRGIFLDGTQHITVANNDIHHNTLAGVYVLSSTNAYLADNRAHDNGSSGIWLSRGPTSGATISGGAYYNNGAAGITEGEGAAGNAWSRIITYGNLGLGVDKANDGLPNTTGSLVITAALRAGSVVSVSGYYAGGFTTLRSHRVELFRADPNPDASGYGESRVYLGSTTFDDDFFAAPSWTVADPTGCGGTYTAILTDYDGLVFFNPSRSSSPQTSALPRIAGCICRRFAAEPEQAPKRADGSDHHCRTVCPLLSTVAIPRGCDTGS